MDWISHVHIIPYDRNGTEATLCHRYNLLSSSTTMSTTSSTTTTITISNTDVAMNVDEWQWQ